MTPLPTTQTTNSKINCVLYSPERPIKFLICTAIGGDVNGKKELFEVYVAVLVRIKCPEYMLAKGRRISGGKKLAVDLDEGGLAQFAGGAVGYEASVPFLTEIYHCCNFSPTLITSSL